MRKKPFLAIVPIAVAAVGLSVAGSATAGKTGPTAAEKLPSSSCSPIFYKGAGSPQYLIASDLPLQGAGRAQPLSMVKAIQYVLEKQYKFRAGTFRVGYQSCDDATAQQGGWATEKCTANARAYANDRSRARRARDVQLGLCQARDPDPQPCAGRPAGDDLIRRTPLSGSRTTRRGTTRASRTSTTRRRSATTPGSRPPTTSRARSRPTC